MPIVEVSGLTHKYGRRTALQELALSIPEGALYALLGPNGSGKTTLMHVLMGLQRQQSGRVALMGTERSALTLRDRSKIGYVAEGQQLPGWMRLEQIEAYLAPLYPSWDPALAAQLRDRLSLDPRQTIKTLSRGQYMKAALLCALAPRPRLLFMDEPFTGMDVSVKDDLVRGLLETSGSEEWTVVICSHDIGELEPLADWIGILNDGRMQLSEPMETLRKRFKRVEIVLEDSMSSLPDELPIDWLAIEQSGQRISFLVSNASVHLVQSELPIRFAGARSIELLDVSLRDVFIALAKHQSSVSTVRAAA